MKRIAPRFDVACVAMFHDSEPLEFTGNAVPLKPLPDMAAVLTRTGLTLLRENKQVGSVALADLLGEPNNLGGAYQTGSKVQPVVFTDDNTRIFVGGRGVIYEIDPLTVKLVDTIILADGQDITSLATVGNWLMIGESGPHGQLLAMNIVPGSDDFGQLVSVRSTDIAHASNGIGGMTIGPDGSTLIVSVPIQATSFGLGNNSQRGNVLVFDLSSLDFKTGQIAPPVVAQLPADGISGKTPYSIAATKDADRYLVTSLHDYNKGLSTLTLTRDSQGHVTAAVMQSIDLSQPNNAIQIDRLDIQRAQSAVLVEKDGVEYAIVADDNLNFLDPYYQAMYTPPDYEFLAPGAPPTAIGGSASAKKVAVGGKLGIIKDPFGKLGTPQYLGATLPVAGYGFQNLSVSPDGTVLIGQLAGRYTSPFDMTQEPNQAHAWNVDALIAAAIASNGNLTDHIVLPTNAEQLIANNTTAPIGTFFDNDATTVYASGNMGDVITVNLKELAAKEMTKRSPDLGWTLQQWEDHMSNFSLARGELDRLTNVTAKSQFIPVLDGNGALLTRNGTPDGKLLNQGDTFAQDGLLFLAPNLTAADEKSLRAGNIVSPKIDHFQFSFTLTGADGKTSTKNPNNWQVSIGASDYAMAPSTLMGDRPLNDPGYSTFTLDGTVAPGSADNHRLDVYRIEQRLRYLGYGDTDPSKVHGAGEITVNGVLDNEEAADLRQFEEIVDGKTKDDDGSSKASPPPAAIEKQSHWLNWLNAYNAPHWMTYSLGSNTALDGWAPANSLTTDPSLQGTSWVHDLMVASQSAAQAQGRHTPLQFAGAGDLGDMLNLGINTDYISKANQAHIDGDEWLLGLSSAQSSDLKPVVPDSTAPAGSLAQLKYLLEQKDALATLTGGKWDSTVAQELADLLQNPNRNPDANNPLNTTDDSPSNASTGPNYETELMKDFLAVYGSIQASDAQNNGSVDEQLSLIQSGSTPEEKKRIQDLLFGDGTQSGGLIDSTNIIMGGNGIGAELDKKTLAATMGISESAAAPWVDVLNSVLASADIDTPKRVAMFLANVAQETTQLKDIFERAYPRRHTETDADGRTYFNNKYNHRSDLGNRLGTDDGSNYRGRGLLHITGRNNYEIATFGFRVSDPSISYTSLNEWLGTQDDSTGASIKDAHSNTLTVTGTTHPGWSVYVVFPKVAGHDAHYGPSVVADATTGAYTYTWVGDGRNGGTVQIIAVKYDLVNNPQQASDISTVAGKTLAAQLGAWYWRFERVTNGNSTWDENPRADTGRFEETWRKINSGEHGANSTQRLNKYLTASNAVYAGASYGNVRDMLGLVGIKAGTQSGYNNKVGITLNKRTPFEIERLTATPADNASAMASQATPLQANTNPLLTDFDADTGDVDMMFIAMPDAPPALVTASVSAGKHGPSSAMMTYGVCAFAANAAIVGNELSPSSYLLDLLPKDFVDRLKINALSQQEWDWLGDWYEHISVSILEGPQHGKVDDTSSVTYYADQGYTGKDRMAVVVAGKDINGRTISMKIIYFINVVSNQEFGNVADNYNQSLLKYCNAQSESWRMAKVLTGPSPQSELEKYSSALNLPSINLSFNDLGVSMLGEEATIGVTTTITLDTSASGHGWFMDANPTDITTNFLPTSNPDVWMAKPGSDAAGKMDLLSVLLHEYGHALGLGHSPNGNDFMGAALQPGERRLPSADELALMTNLLAGVNGDNSTPTTPAPSAPNPLPLGGGTLALVLAGALRRNGYGASTMDVGSARLESQALYLANPTLTNGDFTSASAWESAGDVTIAASSATLFESTATQTRLNQVFTVNTNDRFLRFTVSGINLQNPGDGPQDAFEVALLDASTGQSVEAPIALSNTDDFLNLQGDGSSYLSSGVSFVANADGSRTYLVDLAGIAANTAVNLSFDLIGFGDAGSHVTVSDVHVGLPQTYDDAATTAEDTPFAVDARANDVAANQPGFVPVVVSSPAHG